MKVEIDNLVRVSTYAKQIDKTVTWVDKLAEKGDIEILRIDGVKFVNLNK